MIALKHPLERASIKHKFVLKLRGQAKGHPKQGEKQKCQWMEQLGAVGSLVIAEKKIKTEQRLEKLRK